MAEYDARTTHVHQKVTRISFATTLRVLTAAGTIATALIMWEALRLQRKSFSDQKSALLDVLAERNTLKLEGEPRGDDLIVRVPSGFVLTEGKLYMPPYQSSESPPLIVKHKETTIHLADALRTYERELSDLIAKRRGLHGKESLDSFTIKVPVVAKLSFVGTGSESFVRSLYNLRCKASWNRHRTPVEVRLELLGFGFWKPFDVENTGIPRSDDKAQMEWITRILEFQRRLHPRNVEN